MLLDSKTRVDFMRWLESNISSNEILVKQMKTIGIPVIVIQTRIAETNAMNIVLNILRNTTHETLKAEKTNQSV